MNNLYYSIKDFLNKTGFFFSTECGALKNTKSTV